MEIPFCGEAYKDRIAAANAQECVNLYPFKSPIPSNKDRIILYPTPGYYALANILELFQVNTSTGLPGWDMVGSEMRAMLNINDIVYLVCGNRFVSFNSITGQIQPKGRLLSSSGKVSIATNTVDVTLTDDLNGYVYNLTTDAFTKISNAGAFPVEGVTNLTFQDDYYIAVKKGSRQVIVSSLLDGTSWPALSTQTVTTFPDNAVGAFSDQNQLYIFGRQVAEVQFDAGTIPYPFAKVEGVLIQAGLAAVPTMVKVGTTFIWLANDVGESPYVAALLGYTVLPISSPALNEEICRYVTVTDAFAYTYREADDQFYVISFPTAGRTWAYSLKGKMWHRREYNGGMDLPLCCTYINRQATAASSTLTHVVGDALGGLWYMSQDWSQVAYGAGIVSPGNVPDVWPPVRTRVSPHFTQGGKLIFLKSFELKLQVGVGVNNVFAQVGSTRLDANIANPKVTLYVSKDGGNTWINVGVREMGLTGQYKNRVIWRNLGSAYTWTFKAEIADPVSVCILGAAADIKLGK